MHELLYPETSIHHLDFLPMKGIFQGFTWTAKISTGRDGGKIDG